MRKILKAFKIKKKSDHWIIYFRSHQGMSLFGIDMETKDLYSVEVSYLKKPGHCSAKINPNDRFFWAKNRTEALKIAIDFLKSIADEVTS